MTRRRALHWLIGLAIVLALVIGADRVSAAIASNTAQRYLAKQAAFDVPPKVSINGFPFLTQALSGRYDDVEVRGAAVTLDGVDATDLIAHLHGVHVPLSELFGGRVTTLPVDSVSGSVTFTYAEVVKLSQIPSLAISDRDGQLQVSATLSIPGLGVTAAVTGTGSAQVVAGALRLTVGQLTVAGVSVPAAALSVLEADLAVPIPLPPLPYRLQINAVTATPAGIVVAGSATDVVLAAT